VPTTAIAELLAVTAIVYEYDVEYELTREATAP
jgi:hypothetical protein